MPRGRGYELDGLTGELLRTPDDDPNRIIADRYRLVRSVGSGGMGTVFDAVDLRLGRRCAVKLLRQDLATRPNARRRFGREASLLGRLVHENIVALFDAGVAGDSRAFLVLEYLEGRTLRAEFQEAGLRSLERTLEIVAQVARGLGHAHAEGVVHRDLKPENVMLTTHADGRLLVKLLDFGIARQRDGSGEPITATDVGIGTAAYMAPEQARGERVLGAETDVYALGAVVYEALAGKRPYEGGSYNETLFQILNRSHTPLAEVRPDLPAHLCSAVERALEKSPKARFASVLEFAAAAGADDRAADVISRVPRTADFRETTEVATDAEQRRAPNASERPILAWRFVAGGVFGAALGVLATVAFHRSPGSDAVLEPSPGEARPELATQTAVTAPALAPPEGSVRTEPAPLVAETGARVATSVSAPAAFAPPRTRNGAPRAPMPVTASSNAEPTVHRSTSPKQAASARTAFDALPPEPMPPGYITESPYASAEPEREP